MLESKKIRIASTSLVVIAIVIGFSMTIWSIIYDNHSWNHHILRENHYIDGIIGPLCVALAAIVVFWICNRILKMKLNGNVGKILSTVSFFCYNAAAVATVIIAACNPMGVVRDIKDYQLDCQLASDDPVKVHEAVDSVVDRVHNYDLYGENGINEYMMKAARDGYAPAQNYIGVYFHEQAKKMNDRLFGHGKWSITETSFCQEELNRATYWWLKAARQNHGRAQENLGRMEMNDLLSNRPYCFEDARFWLTEAAKNGIWSAYYYLGLLYRDRSIREAVRYWKTGAEKGNEDCCRMLENPDFIDVTLSETNRQNP